MSINMECETLEGLWEDEQELIRAKSRKFAKQLALRDGQLGNLQRVVAEVRYDAMRDAPYTGRGKGYCDGRREGRAALLTILHAILDKHGGAITVDVSKQIAGAEISELSDWILQLLNGGEPGIVFC